MEPMTDPQTFLQQTYHNLNILKEREAKYAGNAPLDLLNQIEDHEKAIFLTRQRLDSLISEDDWHKALKPLVLAVEPRSDEASGDEATGGPTIGDVSGEIHDANIAGRDITQTTYTITDSSDDDVIVIIQGDVNVGDQFSRSGDFREVLFNIKSTLRRASQSVKVIPGADEGLKGELQRLLKQLSQALQQVPPDQVEAAEAVAQAAEQLVQTTAEEKPNKTLIKITSKSLKEAAQNLAEGMLLVLTVATQIVETVSKFIIR